jgi:hypothetical protein
MSVKYYIYISDSKLDMLWQQIPEASKKRVSRQLKLDWKIVSVSQTVEEAPQEARTMRLRAVERYLLETEGETVGTVNDPKGWIYDTLDLKWGVLDLARGSAALFCGRRGSHGILLSGSGAHVIGYVQPTIRRTFIPSALTGLMSLLDEFGSGDEAEASIFEPASEYMARCSKTAMHFIDHWNAPQQRLQFLSKAFLPHPTDVAYADSFVTMMFGSPLYVAHVD